MTECRSQRTTPEQQLYTATRRRSKKTKAIVHGSFAARSSNDTYRIRTLKDSRHSRKAPAPFSPFILLHFRLDDDDQ